MTGDAPSLLASRALTAEERAATDDEPRPGVGREGAMLDQEETDLRIRRELFALARSDERDDLAEILGRESLGGFAFSIEQRGGVDSDPMVRLLAYRAWRDRDRNWFAERGVYAGEEVTVTFETLPALHVGRAWPNERVFGVARTPGMPGQQIEVRLYDRPEQRFREWPVELAGARDFRDHGDRVGVLLVSERARMRPARRCADVISFERDGARALRPVWTSATAIEALYDECVRLVEAAHTRPAPADDPLRVMDETLRAIERSGGLDHWRTARLLARVLDISEHAVWLALGAYAQRDGLRLRQRVAIPGAWRSSSVPTPASYQVVLAAFGISLSAAEQATPQGRPRSADELTPAEAVVYAARDEGIARLMSQVRAREAEERAQVERRARAATEALEREAARVERASPVAQAEPRKRTLPYAVAPSRSLGQRLRSWLRRDS